MASLVKETVEDTDLEGSLEKKPFEIDSFLMMTEKLTSTTNLLLPI